MNILFFTYDFPFPTTSGGKTRACNLLKYAKNGNTTTLFSFIREGFKEQYKQEFANIGIKNIYTFPRKKVSVATAISGVLHPSKSIFHYLYFDSVIEKQLIEVVKKHTIDIVHFESFYTAFYLSETLQKMGVKQVFGTENIEYKLYKDYALFKSSLFLKPFYIRESNKIEKEEKKLLKKADSCLAVTEHEAEFIKKVTKKHCFVVENGVDLTVFHYKPKYPEKKKNILFIGDFSYFPNRDAVTYFYNNVFTKLTKQLVTFTIIGKHSSKLPFIHSENVVCEEYIADIRDAYYNADVFVSPIKIGGGTNFKVLESMATGVPIVAFPHRLEGLKIKPNKHLLVADSPEEFVMQIEKVLENETLRKSLISTAREHIEKEFSWEVIGKKLNDIWNKKI